MYHSITYYNHNSTLFPKISKMAKSHKMFKWKICRMRCCNTVQRNFLSKLFFFDQDETKKIKERIMELGRGCCFCCCCFDFFSQTFNFSFPAQSCTSSSVKLPVPSHLALTIVVHMWHHMWHSFMFYVLSFKFSYLKNKVFTFNDSRHSIVDVNYKSMNPRCKYWFMEVL